MNTVAIHDGIYKNLNMTIIGEDKGVTELMTPGGKQRMTIINESGLYSLILSSQRPRPYPFKRLLYLPQAQHSWTHM
jgi:prophage antirepressor-like protein